MSGEDKVSGGELCPEDNCVRRRNAFAGDQVSGE